MGPPTVDVDDVDDAVLADAVRQVLGAAASPSAGAKDRR